MKRTVGLRNFVRGMNVSRVECHRVSGPRLTAVLIVSPYTCLQGGVHRSQAYFEVRDTFGSSPRVFSFRSIPNEFQLRLRSIVVQFATVEALLHTMFA